jgi:signal transduction histidine kinase
MYQADEVLSKRHGVIGLGLYICKKNIEGLGGTIKAFSTQGKGATFKFSIPLHVDQTVKPKNASYVGEERREIPRRARTERRQVYDRRTTERLKKFEYQAHLGMEDLARMTYAEDVREYENTNPSKPTILIVEDNAGMMKVIVEALNKEYNLILAFDAYEGLRKLEANKVNTWLILSDIMMPGMSGYDFCKRVMSNEDFRHIPLIFTSALMDQKDQIQGYELGAADYIIKPYNIKILREKIDHWISRRQYEFLLKETSASMQERADQLSRVRDVILHEIRNPLQIISGAGYFIDKLREIAQGKADEKEKQLWENVKLLQIGTQALESVLETTQQLDINALSSRNIENISDIITDSVKQTKHLLGQAQVDWTPEDIDGLFVLCERKMIIQVLINLVRNSAEAIKERKLSDGGRINISACPDNSKQVIIRISDNGIGMDEKVKDNLFKFKFTTKKDGNGIGLHLSKMILKMHGGSISVESKKGEGSIFMICLPLYHEENRA